MTKTAGGYIAVIVVLLMGAISVTCGKMRVTADEVRTELQGHIPLGSPSSLVLERLDSLRIEHSPFDSVAHQVDAIIRETARSATVRTDVKARFVFDSMGTLVAIQAKEVYTGP